MMERRLIGVDIGGSNVKIGIFTTAGELVRQSKFKTPLERNGESIIPATWEMVQATLEAEESPAGIAIGVPGPVKAGTVYGAVNLGWKTFAVKKAFWEVSQGACPVIVGNDASLAAFGEFKARESAQSPFILLTLGTGIGGGIVADGKILEGKNGFAGEFGHMKVHPDGPLCGCGKKGCLESFAGLKGIRERIKEKIARDPQNPLHKDPLKIEDILAAENEGIAPAVEVLEDAVEALGRAASIITTAFDPEALLFGGGLTEAWTELLPRIRERYFRYAFKETIHTPLEKARLGNEAGIRGAMEVLRHDQALRQ